MCVPHDLARPQCLTLTARAQQAISGTPRWFTAVIRQRRLGWWTAAAGSGSRRVVLPAGTEAVSVVSAHGPSDTRIPALCCGSPTEHLPLVAFGEWHSSLEHYSEFLVPAAALSSVRGRGRHRWFCVTFCWFTAVWLRNGSGTRALVVWRAPRVVRCLL